jgi:DNA modification methylase
MMIYKGDALKLLRRFPDECVDCCVTSPPYWGLRDYGVKGQLGVEKTPEEYVAHMVEVFHEVRRVLKKEGTLWLNIGDSYIGSACGLKPGKIYGSSGLAGIGSKHYRDVLDQGHHQAGDKTKCGIPAKNLAGIPWTLALALRTDGWILRQDIIWVKPSVMPERVTDRCTKQHEYLFLLTKSPKYYFEQMKEEGVYPAGTRAAKGSAERQGIRGVNARPPEYKVYDGMRNRRDVWTINTKPFKGAHFAVMPEALVEPCVQAGCPEGGVVLDPFCGSGTVGVVAKRQGKEFVGLELNPEYVKIAKKRIHETKKVK